MTPTQAIEIKKTLMKSCYISKETDDKHAVLNGPVPWETFRLFFACFDRVTVR